MTSVPISTPELNTEIDQNQQNDQLLEAIVLADNQTDVKLLAYAALNLGVDAARLTKALMLILDPVAYQTLIPEVLYYIPTEQRSVPHSGEGEVVCNERRHLAVISAIECLSDLARESRKSDPVLFGEILEFLSSKYTDQEFFNKFSPDQIDVDVRKKILSSMNVILKDCAAESLRAGLEFFWKHIGETIKSSQVVYYRDHYTLLHCLSDSLAIFSSLQLTHRDVDYVLSVFNMSRDFSIYSLQLNSNHREALMAEFGKLASDLYKSKLPDKKNDCAASSVTQTTSQEQTVTQSEIKSALLSRLYSIAGASSEQIYNIDQLLQLPGQIQDSFADCSMDEARRLQNLALDLALNVTVGQHQASVAALAEVPVKIATWARQRQLNLGSKSELERPLRTRFDLREQAAELQIDSQVSPLAGLDF